MPIQQSAVAIVGDVATGLSSAGTTQATATLCTADNVSVTTVTAGQGVILATGNAFQMRSVGNHTSAATGTSLLVYPPVGSAFNGQAANLALNLPAGRAAIFLFLSSTAINVVTT